MFYEYNGMLILKMVPGFLRGGGAFLRMKLFNFDDYNKRYPEIGWLLGKWHNATYYTIKPELSGEQD